MQYSSHDFYRDLRPGPGGSSFLFLEIVIIVTQPTSLESIGYAC
jgi:hypothetical protein